MAYRRTENVVRRLAERERTILDAAQSIAAEGGMGAVQIAPVALRADIAAGTVYRYFPSKGDLVAELIAATSDREVAAMRAAADAAPGPLSALAACIATFAVRAMRVASSPISFNIPFVMRDPACGTTYRATPRRSTLSPGSISPRT